MDAFETLEADLTKWGRALIGAKTTYENLEDDKKDVLSAISNRFSEEPVNRREAQARCEKDWLEFVKGLKVARHDFNQANVMFTITRIKIENLRTRVSYKKAQMNLI